MDERTLPDFSDDQKRLLIHEAFVGQILRLQRPETEEKPSQPWWQHFLESAGAATLIAALIGALGAGLNHFIQEKMKPNYLRGS